MIYEGILIYNDNMSLSSHKSESRPAIRKPMRKRGVERVASLLDAAASVFAQHGYDAATMTDIAAGACAPIGSLYQFFPSKDLVADALYDRQMDALAKALTEAGDAAYAASAPLAGVADSLFVALIDFVHMNPSLPIVADRRGGPASRLTVDQPGMREQIAQILERADPVQAFHAAGLLLLMMKGAVAVGMRGDADTDDLIADIRNMLRARLSA